jgi:hypothetical protein
LGAKYSSAFAVDDAIDLAVGRRAGVDRAVIHRDGEDLRLIGGPQERRFAGGIDAVDAAAVAGAGVERAIGGFARRSRSPAGRT